MSALTLDCITGWRVRSKLVYTSSSSRSEASMSASARAPPPRSAASASVAKRMRSALSSTWLGKLS